MFEEESTFVETEEEEDTEGICSLRRWKFRSIKMRERWWKWNGSGEEFAKKLCERMNE